MPPASPASRPARAFFIARQIMTSPYKGIPRTAMGRSRLTGGVFPSQHRLSAPIPGHRAGGRVEDMIEMHALTKRYGATTAVSDLTFTVQPGTVTGFLGPNGAGKPVTGFRPLFRRRCRWGVICNPAMRSRSRWLVF